LYLHGHKLVVESPGIDGLLHAVPHEQHPQHHLRFKSCLIIQIDIMINLEKKIPLKFVNFVKFQIIIHSKAISCCFHCKNVYSKNRRLSLICVLLFWSIFPFLVLPPSFCDTVPHSQKSS
jgi:hypothetical protein